MADGSWSPGCDPNWWWGAPGEGCWYWSPRFGTYWVAGAVHAKYAEWRYECGVLGAPCSEYGWIPGVAGGPNDGQGCFGQWFDGGAIAYFWSGWQVWRGEFGQEGGRDVSEGKPEPEGLLVGDHYVGKHPAKVVTEAPPDAEVPPGAPSEPHPARPDPPEAS